MTDLRARFQSLLVVDEDGYVPTAEVRRALEEIVREGKEEGRGLNLFFAGSMCVRGFVSLRQDSEFLAAALEAQAHLEDHEPEEPATSLWTGEEAFAWLESLDEDARATKALLAADEPVLREARYRGDAPRRVSLSEWLDIATEALRDAELRVAAHERAEERRAAVARSPRPSGSSWHEEDVGRDVQELRARLPAPGERVPLRELAADSSRLAWVTAFTAALHLAGQGEVRLQQESIGEALTISAQELRKP